MFKKSTKNFTILKTSPTYILGHLEAAKNKFGAFKNDFFFENAEHWVSITLPTDKYQGSILRQKMRLL